MLQITCVNDVKQPPHLALLRLRKDRSALVAGNDFGIFEQPAYLFWGQLTLHSNAMLHAGSIVEF